MTCSVGVYRTALVALASLVLSGCLPSAPGEEEKEPHFLAGRNRVNSLDFRGAIESFEKALEANPKSAPAHFELGWLLDEKEPDPSAAIYHYERFLKLSPNSGKEELVKTRILACKQQLAQTVSLAPGMERLQRDLERLASENKRLQEEVEKWRAIASRPPGPAGPPVTILPGPRGTQAPGSIGAAAAGAVPSQAASASRPPSAAATAQRTHIVRSGETPMGIARAYGVKVETLLAANPRVNPRRMQVGHVLKIPSR